MQAHKIGTRQQWLAARLELLDAEKKLTRQGDEVARQRQALPWVRLDKTYRLQTDAGSATLADLFQGRSQLLVYHFMFGPDYKAGCPSCSSIADGFNGIVTHLAHHDVMLWAVSRAPLDKLQIYKRRMGWTFPGLVGRQRFQLRLQCLVHRDPAARRAGIQLPARRSRHEAGDRCGAAAGIRVLGGDDRHRPVHLPARTRGHERLRAAGRRGLPQLFLVLARHGRDLGHVRLAGPRAERAQRGGMWLRRRDEYGQP